MSRWIDGINNKQAHIYSMIRIWFWFIPFKETLCHQIVLEFLWTEWRLIIKTTSDDCWIGGMEMLFCVHLSCSLIGLLESHYIEWWQSWFKQQTVCVLRSSVFYTYNQQSSTILGIRNPSQLICCHPLHYDLKFGCSVFITMIIE